VLTGGMPATSSTRLAVASRAGTTAPPLTGGFARCPFDGGCTALSHFDIFNGPLSGSSLCADIWPVVHALLICTAAGLACTMNKDEYNAAAFQTFRNALVYTVCSETVRNMVDDSNPTTIAILVAIFAILVSLSAEGRQQLQHFRSDHQVFKVLDFLWDSLHNVIVQFASTLVAKVSISALPPGSKHTIWVFGLTIMTLTLLWLLKESTARAR
jgi:hypothetical protein